MPLYEYLCKVCHHRFEKIQKFSDPLVTQCPECGEDEVEKVISAPAVQFKGSGWYVTDYAKKSSGQSSSTNSSAKTSEAESKTDSKPETKSEPSKSDGKKD